jgi:FlaA1/EpsC-like NDP-sugar epimerase
LIHLLHTQTNQRKRFIAFCYDSIIALISYPLATSIRFSSFDIEVFRIDHFYRLVLVSAIIKIILFSVMKLSRGIWKFSSTRDLLLILKAVSIAILLTAILMFFITRLESIPRSVFIIDWFLCTFLLGGGRFGYRLWKERKVIHPDQKRALLIGAGQAGEQLIREFKNDRFSATEVVGIIDDDPSRHNRTIHGVQVLGDLNQMVDFAQSMEVTQVFVAIPSASKKQTQNIIELCLGAGLKVEILPALKDIADGKVQISQLREVNLEDLLGREPIKLDMNAVGKIIQGKTILVTGAGGSIGSELCRQILNFKPSQLILFDNCEFFIYQIELALRESFPDIIIIPMMGDVRDKRRVKEVFNLYKPQTIFHAAAYKHVPMMEINPLEAVKTNILGTKIIAEEAVATQVENFVLVSTDKAVNPTNVMGATKRIAEIICQSFQELQKTRFTIVRFGNVLGSAGSVIPRFLNQIKEGGPVTVTHPEITRYFMSIPEAAQLVIQAGTLGKGGEIFVLDMGKPVKITKLAEDLILLAGLRPNEDIEIQFTGLRPGEKLYEELLANNENTLPTSHPLVRVAKTRSYQKEQDQILNKLFNLEVVSPQEVKTTLKELVPEYHPQGEKN